MHIKKWIPFVDDFDLAHINFTSNLCSFWMTTNCSFKGLAPLIVSDIIYKAAALFELIVCVENLLKLPDRDCYKSYKSWVKMFSSADDSACIRLSFYIYVITHDSQYMLL